MYVTICTALIYNHKNTTSCGLIQYSSRDLLSNELSPTRLGWGFFLAITARDSVGLELAAGFILFPLKSAPLTTSPHNKNHNNQPTKQQQYYLDYPLPTPAIHLQSSVTRSLAILKFFSILVLIGSAFSKSRIYLHML